MKRHHRIDLPTLTFSILMLCVVILFVLVKTAPGSQKLGGTSIGVGDAWACDRVCAAWGPACNNQCCARSCCIKWKWIGQDCGGTTNPPTITGTVTCAQPGANGWCVNGAQLQLSTSDPQGEAVTISGSMGGSAISCGASCTLDVPEGSGTANYTATDTSNLTSSGSSTYKVDEVNPTLSSVIGAVVGVNGWLTSAVTATASASDSISGIASTEYRVDGGAWTSGTSVTVSGDGTHTIQFRTTNNAGLTTTGNTANVKIDTSAPSLALALSGTSGSNGWYVSPVMVTASASDSVSGIASTQYSVDGGVWQSGSAIAVSGDGSHTVQFKTTNNAGLSTTASQSLKIDQTQPVIAFDPSGTTGSNGWYVSNVNLGISATDATSGLGSSSYSVDGGAPVAINGTASVPLSDGPHTVVVNATDNAGNASSQSQAIKIDTVPPAQTLALNGTMGKNGWYVTDVQASVNATDAMSGVASSTISDNGGSAQPGPIVLADGAHNLTYTTTDAAGNVSTASQTVSVDTMPPVVTIASNGTHGNGTWFVSNAAVTITASDSGSGIASVEYNLDNAGWQAYSNPLTLSDGIHTVQATAVDAAGNSSTPASTTVNVDTTPPLTAITAPLQNAVLAGSVNITGSATDATSGVASAQISFDNVHWQSLSQPANWSYVWDTAPLPNGGAAIYARSTDQAGNTSKTAQIVVTLDNHPPTLIVPSAWTLPQSAALSVAPNVIPLGEVKITAQDPTGNYPDNVLFDNLPAPQQIIWDGMLGRYGKASPGGAYPVIVEACDIYDLCTQSQSMVTVPLTPVPTIASPAPATTIIMPAPTRVIVPARTPVPAPKPVDPFVPPIPKPAHTVETPPWVVIVLAALLLMVALLLLLDPRPAALRRLAKTIHSGVSHHDH